MRYRFLYSKNMKLDVHYASTWKEKTLGLIGKQHGSLYFKTRFGIHTFFLHHSIDVLILDDTYRVKKMKEALPPNRIFLWNILLQHVVELPAGTIRKRNIHEEMKVKLIHK